MNIDPSSFMIYGIPWMVLGALLLFLVAKYFRVSSEVKLFFTALWAVVGFLLVSNIQAIETLWPAMPTILPQVFTAILIFGAMLGFQPGETATKMTKILRQTFTMTGLFLAGLLGFVVLLL